MRFTIITQDTEYKISIPNPTKEELKGIQENNPKKIWTEKRIQELKKALLNGKYSIKE